MAEFVPADRAGGGRQGRAGGGGSALGFYAETTSLAGSCRSRPIQAARCPEHR